MESDRLYFFSKSADKYPGKGVNEQVFKPSNYLALSKISNWRQKLSNFWIAPFEISDGVKFNTVEHMFQAYKINIADPNLAYTFTLNSHSELSRGSGDMAQKSRKVAVLSPEQLKIWDEMKDEAMRIALFSKFTQNPDLKELLLLTGNAQLWHGAPRVPASRQYILEEVRNKIRNQS